MPNPTIITYQGGSAGDMFAAGLNGVEIDFSDRAYVRQPPWSLKHQDLQITCGQIDLRAAVADKCWVFLTTHLFEPLSSSHVPVISIILQDPQAIKLSILRQMQIQGLSIEVKPNETVYRLIKNAADNQKWEKAAQCWFAMARDKWHRDQQHRANHPLPGSWILNFDRLYHADFVDSLRAQGVMTNLDLIRRNHSSWLTGNRDQNYHKTISSMALKLQNMDWTKTEGFIVYDQSR